MANVIHYLFLCFLSSQEQHPSQTSLICFICCVFLILHAPPYSLHQCVALLHQGLSILRAPPTPIPSQLWGPVHVLTWSASLSTSAARSCPLNSSRYSQQECYFAPLSQSIGLFQLFMGTRWLICTKINQTQTSSGGCLGVLRKLYIDEQRSDHISSTCIVLFV